MNKRTLLIVGCSLLAISIVLTVIFGFHFFAKVMYALNVYIFAYLVAVYKQNRTIRLAMSMIGLLLLVSFIAIQAAIIQGMKADDNIDERPVSFVIVLGAGLKGDQLSNTLKQRLDQAFEYASSHRETRIILSGGQGKDEFISEAEAMFTYLTSLGLSPDRLLLEDKSTSTRENIKFSKTIMEELGVRDPKVLIVTSEFHMFRAKKLAESMQIEALGLPSETLLWSKLNYMLREYFAVVKMLLLPSLVTSLFYR